MLPGSRIVSEEIDRGSSVCLSPTLCPGRLAGELRIERTAPRFEVLTVRCPFENEMASVPLRMATESATSGVRFEAVRKMMGAGVSGCAVTGPVAGFDG